MACRSLKVSKSDGIVSLQDYYPFGMEMAGRSYSSSDYRFNFQGQEKDSEYMGGGIAFKYRIHDVRIGRFLSVDPLTTTYPWNSSYSFSCNIVIHAFELEGLEATVGVSFGGDVDYRKSHLEMLKEDAITATIFAVQNPDDPSEIVQLVDILKQATQNDPTGTIGFTAIWGHGRGGDIFGDHEHLPGPYGALYMHELDALGEAMKNGEISFSKNAIIFITACNAGTDLLIEYEDVTAMDSEKRKTRMTSFAQELADITGATVIAGRDVSGDGGVAPLVETRGETLSSQMRNHSTGSFFRFNAGVDPVNLGVFMDTGALIERGREITPSRIEPKRVNEIGLDENGRVIVVR